MKREAGVIFSALAVMVLISAVVSAQELPFSLPEEEKGALNATLSDERGTLLVFAQLGFVSGTKIIPGEALVFELNLSSFQEKKEEAELTYELINANTNQSFLRKQERVVIEGKERLLRKLAIPEAVPEGNYFFQVNLSLGTMAASITERIVVEKMIVSREWEEAIPAVLSIIVLSAFLLGGIYYLVSLRRKLKAKALEEKMRNSKYPVPDFLTLPQSKYVYVGLIADSDEQAYLDHTQLNRHTLIAGGTGCGKTVTAMDIVEEVLKKGVSVTVLDPVGQWSGFAKKCDDEKMRKLYKKFGMGLPRAYEPRIVEISDATLNIDVVHYLKKAGLTVLRLDKLTPRKADAFIEGALQQVYREQWNESGSLKALLVLDEVHRLLPKYGGRKAYVRLEQAVREFRKWGIGLLMISQVLTDFKGAIRGNIGTEIQMRTRYEGDIKRVRERHGADVSKLIARLSTGLGMLESVDYNRGNAYFMEFRPLLHSPYKLSNEGSRKLVRKETPILLSTDAAGT